MICTSLHLYLQHEKAAVALYRRVPSEKKHWTIIADTVANVIAALLMYQLPTMLTQFMTQFLVTLSNDPFSLLLYNDVIMPRPLRPSALWGMA